MTNDYGNLVQPTRGITAILEHPLIIGSAARLTNSSTRVIEPGKNLVLVQRERATCLPQFVDLIGSEDATTCHVVALRSTLTAKTALCHLDGSQNQMPSMNQMIGTFTQHEQANPIEVHIVGGFEDEGGLSTAIFMELIPVLCKSTAQLHLVTGCVGPLNSRKKKTADGDLIDEPIVRGIAISTKSGEICSATFRDRGPDLPLRFTYSFGGGPELLNVYDTEQDLLMIPHFPYRIVGALDHALLLPDSRMLSFFSTSPDVEGPNFLPDLRLCFTFMRNNPDHAKFWEPGVARVYARDPITGRWCETHVLKKIVL